MFPFIHFGKPLYSIDYLLSSTIALCTVNYWRSSSLPYTYRSMYVFVLHMPRYPLHAYSGLLFKINIEIYSWFCHRCFTERCNL